MQAMFSQGIEAGRRLDQSFDRARELEVMVGARLSVGRAVPALARRGGRRSSGLHVYLTCISAQSSPWTRGATSTSRSRSRAEDPGRIDQPGPEEEHSRDQQPIAQVVREMVAAHGEVCAVGLS